ncbi:hypothetical protein [Streptomyces roseolus]|uniref:hypothetical protein n=1 Tax=Streptomyces roseolus TaxID=67358 RepID=UPI001987857E|nr:hypothetical protein [Streptomyces roseolus]GGR55076.1 hypothetical protein GCM10010282_55230 [Streptomyces roseolus]
MTTDLPHIPPADDDLEPTGPTRRPSYRPAVSPYPSGAPGAASFPDRPALPPSVPADPAVTVLPAAPAYAPAPQEAPETAAAPEAAAAPEPQEAPERSVVPETPAAPEVPAPSEASAAPEAPAVVEAQAGPGAPDQDGSGGEDGSGDEAVHTLLRTAATERPVEEVAALVARLQETGELSSPADVALRAAAVSRPLGEVRQLLALLNASGYDLHQAETTLRAAAVGRPIEDVVQLVGILGADSSDWQPTPGGDVAARQAGSGGEDGTRAGGGAGPAAEPKGAGGTAERRRSVLDGALATGPGSHDASPALRSALRWPAAGALFVCGLVHLPTDLAGLRSGGDAQTLSVVVSVLSLVCAVWLASRDTLIAWAASAGLAVVVIALHGVASARAVDLLAPSLGTTFAWARALALLSAMAVVFLAGSAIVRHAKAAAAPDGA